jgi:uncharacterized protein YprB with RNaseH-like and TPR domain
MRIVAFDLETTGLGGNFGRILCCSFKPITPDQEQDPYTFRGDDKKYRGKDIVDDGVLAVAIRDELEKYDVIVGHNSKLFDAKFLNARLLKAGARPRLQRFHVDTMWIVRSHFRMSSKLDNVQKMLNLPDEKSPIDWDEWARAGTYLKKAMDNVVHHCEQDVRVLEQAYWRLLPSMRNLRMG